VTGVQTCALPICYRLVRPGRSDGGQRLYSREQVEQLRFVKRTIAEGRRPSEAHRLLSERIARGDAFDGTRLRVLLAESRLGAADVLRELLGAEAFELLLASNPDAALSTFEELSPAIVVVDTGDSDFLELTDRLRDVGVKVLPLDLLEQPLALLGGKQAQLA